MDAVLVISLLGPLLLQVAEAGYCGTTYCTLGCCTTDAGAEECCTAVVLVFGVIAAVASFIVVIVIFVIICCCKGRESEELLPDKGSRPSSKYSTSNISNGVTGSQYPLMPLRSPISDDRYTQFPPWTDDWEVSTLSSISRYHTQIPTPTGSTYSVRTSTVVDLPSYHKNLNLD